MQWSAFVLNFCMLIEYEGYDFFEHKSWLKAENPLQVILIIRKEIFILFN